MKTVPQVTALQAQSAVNYFLSDRISDRFTADLAQLTTSSDAWQVPVLLTYPIIGSIGQVGVVLVSTTSEKILSCTSIEEMLNAGQKLSQTVIRNE